MTERYTQVGSVKFEQAKWQQKISERLGSLRENTGYEYYADCLRLALDSIQLPQVQKWLAPVVSSETDLFGHTEALATCVLLFRDRLYPSAGGEIKYAPDELKWNYPTDQIEALKRVVSLGGVNIDKLDFIQNTRDLTGNERQENYPNTEGNKVMVVTVREKVPYSTRYFYSH
jgi:hypothetical protein